MALEALGFLGYGNMAAAIAEGLVRQSVVAPKHITIYDPSPDRQFLAQELGLNVADTPTALAQNSTTIVLAVKPQIMTAALEEIHDALTSEHRLISIAAGISIAGIQGQVPSGVRVIRVMPNTPALAQAGAAGIACSTECDDTDRALADEIFAAVGLAVHVDEAHMDAVTAVSGSGPAYFFYMVECLIEAGVNQGLDHDTASRLASQTLLGAGQLLAQSEDGPGTLREKVTSPGGTTEAALNTFRSMDLQKMVQAAVDAAVNRSKELGS